MRTLDPTDCPFIPAGPYDSTFVFPPNSTNWLFDQLFTVDGGGWAYVASDDLEPYVPQAQPCPE